VLLAHTHEQASGGRTYLIADEDAVMTGNPGFPGSSRELKGAQRELKGPARRFSHAGPGVAEELGAAA
jgi:hypothetical protein